MGLAEGPIEPDVTHELDGSAVQPSHCLLGAPTDRWRINKDTINIRFDMRTTSKIINAEGISESLRSKLKLCGTRTCAGYWNWCRSPCCDRCRRHRARTMADAVSGWAMSANSFTLRKIRVEAPRCSGPDRLIEAINQTRVTLRRAFDRRQREHERWGSIRCLGCFLPSFDGALWSATFHGVLDLGRVHEVTFLDAIEPLVEICLQSFPAALIQNDVHAHVHCAFSNTNGLRLCEPVHLAAYAASLTARGGYKGLVYRRGFQA